MSKKNNTNKTLSNSQKQSKPNENQDLGSSRLKEFRGQHRITNNQQRKFYDFLENRKKEISELENSDQFKSEPENITDDQDDNDLFNINLDDIDVNDIDIDDVVFEDKDDHNQFIEEYNQYLEQYKRLDEEDEKKDLLLYKYYLTYNRVKDLSNLARIRKGVVKNFEQGSLGPLIVKRTKLFRLDSFAEKYQVNSMFRFKSLHKKKVKLDRSYSLLFRKSHLRSNERPTDRWTFVLTNFFKHFYKLNYFMTQGNLLSSVSEASQKINYRQVIKNNRHNKSSSSIFAGDMVVYNGNGLDLDTILESKKSRSYLNTFIEEDDYTQGVIVVKDVTTLSREDTLCLNIASNRFVDINFLRK